MLARAQPDDRPAHPCGFTGFHLKLAHQPVPLVEQANDGHALGHRGRAFDPADLVRDALGFGDGLNRRAAIPF
ncbi:hypothetical protein [Sphingopyxis sp. EG6]|uniref:hypothetical protein n=1 Tax=Sphingopyxis sp. EG6 TaxID=1874061 RepID=UPI000DC64105|nr:hypothetical protein [Sphingopyxis sp. EG6]BBB09873.1 hypothetical protein SPYCW_2889 [Sphingopyxis sp. EG6]